MTDRWPWPGDTPTERARRIANSLLLDLPEDVREAFTKRAHALGETWLGADLLCWTNDDIVLPAIAARQVHATPELLRSWVRMGVLERTGRGYRIQDVLDAAAEVRRRRKIRAARRIAKA